MHDFMIRPSDILGIMKRQRMVMLVSFLLTSGLIIGLTFIIPKTYLSESIVHFSVGYFQNPLIGDLVSQTSDPGELRSEREKLLSESLNIDFVNKVGEKFELFKRSKDDPARTEEAQLLLKKIEAISVTQTQYRLTCKASSPQVAQGIVKEALQSIREHMYSSRITMLDQLMVVVGGEADKTKNDESGSGTHKALFSSRGESASAQMAELNRKLIELRRNFSEQHPSIQAIKDRIAEIKTTGKPIAAVKNPAHTGLFSKALEGSAEARGDSGNMLRDDLLRKKHLVSIALEIEKKDPSMSSYISVIKEATLPTSPVFPKIRLFILFGLVAGIMVATVLSALIEFYQRTEIQAADVSKKLGIPMLGSVVLLQDKR